MLVPSKPKITRDNALIMTVLADHGGQLVSDRPR